MIFNNFQKKTLDLNLLQRLEKKFMGQLIKHRICIGFGNNQAH
jgi:hypothetical protein